MLYLQHINITYKEIRMHFNEKLKKLRKEKKLTQRELAEITDIGYNTIRNYERGDRKPKIENILKLSKALGVSPEEMTNTLGEYMAYAHLSDKEALISLFKNPSYHSQELTEVLLSFIKNIDYLETFNHYYSTYKFSNEIEILLQDLNQLLSPYTKLISALNDLMHPVPIKEWINDVLIYDPTEQEIKDNACRCAEIALSKIIQILNPSYSHLNFQNQQSDKNEDKQIE